MSIDVSLPIKTATMDVQGMNVYNKDDNFKKMLQGDFENVIDTQGVITAVGDKVFSGKSIKNLSFPECVSVGFGAFTNCTELREVYLPKVSSVGINAFSTCKNLLSINLPEALSIGGDAFWSCAKLETAIIPKCLIISDFFENCRNLKTVSAPGCSRILTGFLECNSLEEVYIPNCRTLEGSNCFRNCTKLKSLSLPNVSLISGSYMFYGCGVSRLYLPAISRMTGPVFYSCSISQLIINRTSVPQIDAYAFISSPFADTAYLGFYASVYVPSEALSLYKNATHWSSIADRIVSIDELGE